jgi:hypothetical protein
LPELVTEQKESYLVVFESSTAVVGLLEGQAEILLMLYFNIKLTMLHVLYAI